MKLFPLAFCVMLAGGIAIVASHANKKAMLSDILLSQTEALADCEATVLCSSSETAEIKLHCSESSGFCNSGYDSDGRGYVECSSSERAYCDSYSNSSF